MPQSYLRKLSKSLSSFLETLVASGVESILMASEQKSELNQSIEIQQPAISASDRNLSSEWVELRTEVLSCTKCDELTRTRKSIVFGSGNPNADLVFVGEAPGYEEDVQGLPFVGKAGQLLTKMIEAIGMKRSDVFICNVLKCRPPQNRNPHPYEIANCSPYLWRQLEIIKPKLICALGTFAAQTILGSVKPISSLRGIIHECKGFRVICTFHPAYLLRNPFEKRKAWEDLKKVKSELQ